MIGQTTPMKIKDDGLQEVSDMLGKAIDILMDIKQDLIDANKDMASALDLCGICGKEVAQCNEECDE